MSRSIAMGEENECLISGELPIVTHPGALYMIDVRTRTPIIGSKDLSYSINRNLLSGQQRSMQIDILDTQVSSRDWSFNTGEEAYDFITNVDYESDLASMKSLYESTYKDRCNDIIPSALVQDFRVKEHSEGALWCIDLTQTWSNNVSRCYAFGRISHDGKLLGLPPAVKREKTLKMHYIMTGNGYNVFGVNATLSAFNFIPTNGDALSGYYKMRGPMRHYCTNTSYTWSNVNSYQPQYYDPTNYFNGYFTWTNGDMAYGSTYNRNTFGSYYGMTEAVDGANVMWAPAKDSTYSFAGDSYPAMQMLQSIPLTGFSSLTQEQQALYETLDTLSGYYANFVTIHGYRGTAMSNIYCRLPLESEQFVIDGEDRNGYQWNTRGLNPLDIMKKYGCDGFLVQSMPRKSDPTSTSYRGRTWVVVPSTRYEDYWLFKDKVTYIVDAFPDAWLGVTTEAWVQSFVGDTKIVSKHGKNMYYYEQVTWEDF